MRLHEQRFPRSPVSPHRRALLALLAFIAVWLGVRQARADLALDDHRSIERRVVIQNQSEFAGWQIVAYPYNFSLGVPKLGLAKFDVIGLTPPRFVDAHIYAIPPGNKVEIPENLGNEEGEKRLKAAKALDSGWVLGSGNSVKYESEIRSVREVLRIKEITPERFELERVALEYKLEDDVVERVDCPPRGSCPGPAREPGVRLALSHRAGEQAEAAPSPAPSVPGVPSVDPHSPAALPSSTPPTTPPPPPERPMSPLIWVAIAALILGVGLFALRSRD